MPELGILRSAAVRAIAEAVLPDALEPLAPLIAERFDSSANGNMPRWLAALDRLPDLTVSDVNLGDRVTLEGRATAAERAQLEAALLALQPWRKGPFSLFGVVIDTEWRSDRKWRRVAPHLHPLAGRRVLDVGSGNGYFGWRMLEAGARLVVGVDPTVVFCLQHLAINRYLRNPANQVLPVRFEELPDVEFDTVFSMGVIYHRRDPAEHAQRLFRHTRAGGQVVVESLVVEAPVALVPDGRYARMRNVWIVPTPELLPHWLAQAGFVDIQLVDLTPTTVDEQHSTAWMRFESLAQALDPERPGITVEGHPAPVRGVVIARKPPV
jgi:tRNA (mo5U34)-methyltransferase